MTKNANLDAGTKQLHSILIGFLVKRCRDVTLLSAAVVSLFLLSSQYSLAQVSTNITPESNGGTSINFSADQSGNTISIDGGSVSGRNLFHDFQQFDLASGDTALWERATGDARFFLNVINRVHGSDASEIHGRLDASQFANADFYFINPAGVIFGKDASVAVPNGFHVSTANSLRFSDGMVLSFDGNSGSSLSSAAPESFGFVDSPSLGIQVHEAKLRGFREGSNVTLSGHQVTIDGAVIDVSSGRLQIASIKVGSGFLLNDPDQSFADMQLGDILIGGNSQVYSDAVGADSEGAYLLLAGRNIHLTEDAQVTSDGLSAIDGGRVVLRASGNLTVDSGSVLRSSAFKSGSVNGVNVVVEGAVVVDGTGAPDATDVTGIISSSQPERGIAVGGDAGNVSISASDVRVVAGGQIQSLSFARGGDSGMITINADTILIDGARGTTLITNSVERGSLGKSNEIFLNVIDLTVQNGGQIQSSTFTDQDGGAVIIRSGGLIQIDGGTDDLATGIFAQSEPGASGDAGDISIEGRNLSILSGGDISTSAVSTGGSGTISIILSDALVISGDPDRSTGVFSQSGASSIGPLGSIFIVAGDILLQNDAAISALTRSETVAEADEVSTVAITSRGNLTISSGANITTESLGPNSSGSLSVSADDLTVDGIGSQISSSNGADGQGGSISIAAQSVNLTNNGTVITSSVSGAAGEINLSSQGAILLDNAATIRSESVSGEAGRIELQGALGVQLSNNAALSTNSEEAAAGDIIIRIGEDRFLILNNSEATTSGVRGVSDLTTGGRIIVESADQETPFGGTILINGVLEALGDGSGALLSIDNSGVLLKDQSSIIAVSGTIDIPETALGNDQENLGEDFLNATDVLASQCLAQRSGAKSALSIKPRLTERSIGDIQVSPFAIVGEQGGNRDTRTASSQFPNPSCSQ